MSLTKKILLGLGIFLGSIILFLFLLFGTASLLTSGLKKPIQEQLAALQVEDYAKAYSFTTRDFQEVTTFETFKKYVDSYIVLRNNKGISFKGREIEDGVGKVEAVLISRGGVELPVIYYLKKENKVWRINSIVMEPDEAKEKGASLKTSQSTQSPAASASLDRSKIDLSQLYQNKRYKFSINYPANWSYAKTNQYTVVFQSKDPALKFMPVINVQAIASVKSRGTISIDSFFNEIATRISQQSTNFSIVDQGVAPIPAHAHSIPAKYALYQFTIEGNEYRRLEVVYYQEESRALFALAYTNLRGQFDSMLPLAQAMAESFSAL